MLTWLGPLIFGGLFVLPLLSGLIFTLIPSFGYLPSVDNPSNIGQEGQFPFNLDCWREVLDDPRLLSSTLLTWKVGMLSSLGSLGVVFGLGGILYQTRLWRIIEGQLPFFLSVPHAALAIGLVYVIAPNGFIFRLLTLIFPDLQPSTDLITYQDLGGYSLILGLLFKEIPFLFFVTMARMSQISQVQASWVAQSLGYSPFMTWAKVIWPQIYSGLRLPLLIIMSYSFSTVDMSYVLGPTNPPTFILLILEWFQSPELNNQKLAAVGAILLFLLLGLTIVMWLGLERLVAWVARHWYINGWRGRRMNWVAYLGAGLWSGIAVVTLLTFLVNLVWSVAKRWPFPDHFPRAITLRYWEKLLDPHSFTVLLNTLLVAFVVAFLSLGMVILLLEGREALDLKNRFNWNTRKDSWQSKSFLFMVYLPLLVPQILFLLGLEVIFQTVLVHENYIYYIKVIWAHFFFVFPYTYLTLSDSYESYDRRYVLLSKTFMKGNWKILKSVKLPMLYKPILFSLSIGLSVSIMEYLSTVIMGAGRVETITTEAVHLTVGGNRRQTGVYSTLQMVFPFLFIFISTYLTRYREQKQSGQLARRRREYN